MPDAPAAYPLAWPAGRPRRPAHDRTAGPFATQLPSLHSRRPLTLAEARERLAAELDRLGATAPVLSTNVALRVDGQPRFGQPQPADPGAAVYFRLNGEAIALACDRFTKVEQNVAALSAHIEATRRIERYGVAKASEMFTGFLALPAPASGTEQWRVVLGHPRTLDEAEARYRHRIKLAHPDAGGDPAEAAALTAAIAEARKVLR